MVETISVYLMKEVRRQIRSTRSPIEDKVAASLDKLPLAVLESRKSKKHMKSNFHFFTSKNLQISVMGAVWFYEMIEDGILGR